MGSALYDPSAVQHEDPVRAAYNWKRMGDHDHRLIRA